MCSILYFAALSSYMGVSPQLWIAVKVITVLDYCALLIGVIVAPAQPPVHALVQLCRMTPAPREPL